MEKINEVVDLTKRLISIPSDVSKSNNEGQIANFIFQYLNQLGKFKIEKQVVEGNRFNIIATIGDPKYILFGHMDTVPRQDQNRNPFEPFLDGDRLYGLGSADMKSGLAVMLYVAKYCNRKDVGFIFTVDEEYLFKGAYKLVEEYKFSPELVINFESTDLKIANGCRGIIEFEMELEGKSVHASRKEEGINVIEKTLLITQILQEKLNMEDDFAKSSVNIASIQGGTLSNNEVKTIPNFVPNYARSTIEIRLGNKKYSKEFTQDLVSKIASDNKVKLLDFKVNLNLGSMYTSKSALEKFEKAISKVISCEYKDINETGFYEIQLVQEKWNCPTIAFGPGVAISTHTSDEYVSIDSLNKLVSIMEEFLKY